jgi:hypothetical protein
MVAINRLNGAVVLLVKNLLTQGFQIFLAMVEINRLNEVVVPLVKSLLTHPQLLAFLARVVVETIALMEMMVNGTVDADVNQKKTSSVMDEVFFLLIVISFRQSPALRL